MSININPTISIDDTIISFEFNFPLPTLIQAPYNWTYPDGSFIAGTNGTDSECDKCDYVYIPPDTSITPYFRGFIYRDDSNSTDFINYVSEIVEYESLVFQAVDESENLLSLKDVDSFLSLEEVITGDTDYLYLQKYFRYSNRNNIWSEFLPLTESTLKELYGDPDILLQFRYTSIPLDTNLYNKEISITKQNVTGWEKLYSGTSFFEFDIDYSHLGTTEYVIGLGNDNDYYLDIESNKLYGNKYNGKWGSPVIVTEIESSSGVNYIPSYITQEILDSAVRGIGIPLDDITLTPSIDILFGTDLSIAEQIPKMGNNVFINKDFKGFETSGFETLRIKHTPRVLPTDYTKRLYLNKVSLSYQACIDIRDVEFILNNNNTQVILKPNIMIKAFSFNDFYLDCSGCADFDVKFRTSPNQRFWSEWIILNKENVSSIVPDPLSFFYIEFLFTKTTNEDCDTRIYDLIIYGDYQNITDDYKQLNKFGLRSDCNYALSTNGDADNILGVDANGNLIGDSLTDCGVPTEWTNAECQGSFNPYDYNKSLSLYNKLANDVSNIFGFEINYYRTDPDANGRDVFLHEYQLYNVIDRQNIKVIFPDNKYPENVVQFNQFDLSLFESFEIHITKEEFHNKFGIGRRPAKYDILEICQLNRVYDVEHAQSYKDFMGGSIYYKVVLKKHEDNKHINNGSYEPDLQALVKNNSLDSLLQNEVDDEFKKITNNELQENLTEIGAKNITIEEEIEYLGENPDNVIIDSVDHVPSISDKPIHNSEAIFISNIESDLQNGPNIISRNYYDMSSKIGQIALSYTTQDDCIKKSDNRTFTLWFNINDYIAGQEYNFINNYNSLSNTGYKIYFIDGRVEIYWNELFYEIDVNVKLKNWYGVVVCFNQKQSQLDFSLYKIKDSTNPTSATDSSLETVTNETFDLIPQVISIDEFIRIDGSPMLWTNMRLFNEYVSPNNRELILNQYVVKNTQYLIIGDNANRKVISDQHKF